MDCILCRWLCDRFCPPEMGRDAFWNYVYRWEEAYAAPWEPWEEDDLDRERRIAFARLAESDPAAAVREFSQLPESDGAWASRWLGYAYETGTGTAQDLQRSLDHYRIAVQAGSFMASLELAKLLFETPVTDEWESVLEEGDERGFIPSTFWLAWYRYKRKPKRSTARQSRPLLEKAAIAGHPGARRLLARWKLTGKFGLREMREGFREADQVVEQFEGRELPVADCGRNSE